MDYLIMLVAREQHKDRLQQAAHARLLRSLQINRSTSWAATWGQLRQLGGGIYRRFVIQTEVKQPVLP